MGISANLAALRASLSASCGLEEVAVLVAAADIDAGAAVLGVILMSENLAARLASFSASAGSVTLVGAVAPVAESTMPKRAALDSNCDLNPSLDFFPVVRTR